MRLHHVLTCLCLIGSLAVPLGARIGRNPVYDLTVILDFKGPHSEISRAEMERESSMILKTSGVRLGWQLPGDEPGQYANLVMMTFRGSCMFSTVRRKFAGPGPYGLTRITDGEVQPFAEVDCDRVVAAAGDAIPEDLNCERADQLIGRALGRVVAHELVHMLTKSNRHGIEGVAKASLSGKELIGESLTLSMLDIERVKKVLR